MAEPAAEQRALDLGPQAHFDLLHGGHQHAVALASATPKQTRDWWERLAPHDEARGLVETFAGIPDSYISQAGFNFSEAPEVPEAIFRRSTDSVRSLPALFVDLDVYMRPSLANLTHSELVNRIKEAMPWLPMPTLVADSGRGFYLIWRLEKDLPGFRLHEWQTAETALVEALEPFAADPKAKDAARVLRVPESTNTKSDTRVQYQQIGPVVAFSDMKRALRDNHLNQKAPQTPKSPPQWTQAFRTAKDPYRAMLAAHRLHKERLDDFDTLASIRAPMDDCRHRTLFEVSISAAWFYGSVEGLTEHLRSFAERHFRRPDRYTDPNRVQTVLERMVEAQKGGRRQWTTPSGEIVPVDPKYRRRNDSILEALEVTEVEERQFTRIIGAPEKRRRDRNRKTEERRRKGAIERSEYEARAASRRELAQELRTEGMTHQQIADELGITKQRVSQLVKAG